MRCRIYGINIWFEQYTEEEILHIRDLLTWEDEYKKTSETLLFKDPYGNLFTFWGLYKFINSVTEFPIELANPPSKNIERINAPKDLLEGITLYDFQASSVSKSLMLKFGLNEIPTSGGKSEIMLSLLRHLLNEKTINSQDISLVTVPSVPLAEQFKKRALERGFSTDEIGVFHGNKKQINCPIVVAVCNSLVRGINKQDKKVLNLIYRCVALLFDEVHHLRSETWVKVALAASRSNLKYLLGYSGSATHEEDIFKNSGDALIYGLTGGPIYRIQPSYLRKIGLTSEPLIYYEKIGGGMAKYPGKWHNIYNKYIVENEKRNKAIKSWVDKFVSLGFPAMILVQRKEHANNLMHLLQDHRIISVFGGSTAVVWEETGLETYQIDYGAFSDQFEKGSYDIIVASQVFDEGVDLPSVGMVVLAGGGKSRIKALQRLGRGVRGKKQGPNRVYVLDFDDNTHVYMKAHSKKRKQIFLQDAEATILEDKYMWFNTAYEHAREVGNVE